MIAGFLATVKDIRGDKGIAKRVGILVVACLRSRIDAESQKLLDDKICKE